MDEGPNPEDRIGHTLGGKWKLDRLIGEGGMAAVYAATHRNGATAAIKILNPEFARRADTRTRFLREAYIANKAGKGAVQVLDDDVDDDGSPYLVMELLKGEPVDLRAQRLGGKLALRDVVWIARQTLATLADAHAAGIIHRDLKPENLFWTVFDKIKVLDFGIARLRDAKSGAEATRTGMIMGTLGFMSPEQAIGANSEIDLRADIFSMGAIMFRLITGREIHEGRAGNALVIAATKDAPPLLKIDPSVPAAVAEIVDRALAKNRDFRYPSARAMLDELERVELVDDPIEPVIESVRIPKNRIPRIEMPDPAPDSSRFDDVEPASMGYARGMSDADASHLRDVFGLLESALRARAESGPAHPQTIRQIDVAYRRAMTALGEAHIGLFCNVRAEGYFARGAELLWAPRPPLAPSSLDLYQDRVRMLGLLPGLRKGEFEAFVALLAGEKGSFGDYATLLQSSGFEHVVFRIEPRRVDTFAEESDSLVTAGEAIPAKMILASLTTTTDPSVRASLLPRLERRAGGQEADIGAALPAAGVDLAMGLIRILYGMGTPEARAATGQALRNPIAIVRIEAMSKLGMEERLRAELHGALETALPEARMAALVEVEKYKVRAAGPVLAMRARSQGFDGCTVKERRLLLQALATLLPSRAEAIAIELLKSHRLLSGDAHEETREIAADLLGRIGISPDARAALEEATKTGWLKRGGRVRDVAAEALAGIRKRATAEETQRLAKRSPSGRPGGEAKATRTSKRPPSPSKRPPGQSKRPPSQSKRPPRQSEKPGKR